MYEQVRKPKENNSRVVTNSVTQKKSDVKQGFGFVDNRMETIAQRKIQKEINNIPQEKQAAQLQGIIQRNQDYKEKDGNNTMTINDSKSGLITATTTTKEGEYFSTLEYQKGDTETEWIVHEIHSNLRGHGGAMMHHLCLLAEKSGVMELHATSTAVEAYKDYKKWGFAPDAKGVQAYINLGITDPDTMQMVGDWYAKVKTVKSETGSRLFGFWNKKGCFLTSACVEHMGLPDDCIELRVLRKFRDEYLMETDSGSILISDYYAIAPDIVTVINQNEKASTIYENIYKCIQKCVCAIQLNQPIVAMEMYEQMVTKLRAKFSS